MDSLPAVRRVKGCWQRDEAPTTTLPRLLEGTRREREGYVRRRQRAEREAEAVRLHRQAAAARQRQRERERKRRRLEKAGKIVCDVQQPLRWGGVQGEPEWAGCGGKKQGKKAWSHSRKY